MFISILVGVLTYKKLHFKINTYVCEILGGSNSKDARN